MTESEKYYRELLHKKIQSQFNSFKEKLMLKDKDELIRNSYEITIKSEIVDLFIPLKFNFTLDEIKGLLNRENILDDLYIDWMKSDSGIHITIKESLEYKIEQYSNEYKDYLKINKTNERGRE